MRPILRPGHHVLRRDTDELQIGLHSEDAVILPKAPTTAPFLRALDGVRTDAQLPDRRTLSLLTEAGLLVDADRLVPRLGRDPLDRAAAAAVARQGDPEQLLHARASAHVPVRSFGPPDVFLRLLDPILARAGLAADADPPTRARRRQPATPAPRPDVTASHADVVLVAGVGEPPREMLDDLMRDGAPHLLIRLHEGAATLGPLVVPGESACLRCLDAHHRDADPAWPLLVEQYAAAVRTGRADGVPEPVDPLLAGIALSWAARSLVCYVEGRGSALLSSTLRLDADLAAVESRIWSAHPACGCGWRSPPLGLVSPPQ